MTDAKDILKKDAVNCDLNNTTEVRANGNSDEYEYVTLLESRFDRSLFPSDFNEWIISQKYSWINKNLSKFYPNVPKSLLEFIPASFHRVDRDRSPIEKPEWLDIDKYRRGQKFVQDYFVGITITIVLGLLHAFTFENDLNVFILSGRVHTPYLGFQRCTVCGHLCTNFGHCVLKERTLKIIYCDKHRTDSFLDLYKYLSTMCRMMNWFAGDPWVKETPAYKDMEVVRKMHVMMRARLSRLSNDEIKSACTFANPWCPDRELLLKDFAKACPFEKIGQRPYNSFLELPLKRNYINDADMAVIQCCFVSPILLHPQKFGVHDATDEDIETFCYIWKCYGYFLGMEDKYNFCRGNFEEIKQRSRDFYQYWIIPNLKDVTSEWEHMTRCVIEPFNYFPFMYMSYKSAMLLATDIFDINMSCLYASLSYLDWITYNIWKFVLRYALKLSSIRSLFNNVLQRILYQMTNCNPEKKAQLHMQSKKQTQDFTITF